MKRFLSLILILILTSVSCGAYAEDALSRFWDSIRDPVSDIVDAAGDLLDEWLDEGLGSLEKWAEDLIDEYGGPLVQAAKDVLDAAEQWINEKGPELVKAFEDGAEKLGAAADEAGRLIEELKAYAAENDIEVDTILRLGLALIVQTCLEDISEGDTQPDHYEDIPDMLKEYGITDEESAEHALELLLE